MIEARGLVKRHGATTAVDHLSFDARPGTVTAFAAGEATLRAVALAVGGWALARRDA